MLYDEKAKVASRIRMEEKDGKKVRVYKKTGAEVK
jgi:large subunit ribosomal protein L24